MRRIATRLEVVGWALGALVTGAVIAWLDLPAREYESGLLVYLLAGFWLAVPGRAPSTLLAVACGLAPQMALYLLAQSPRPLAIGAAGVATFAGAAAGRIAGARLEGAHGAPPSDEPWYRRPIGARTLLPVALSAIAVVGLVPVWALLRQSELFVGLSLVRWWQGASFVGWVLVAPSVLRWRGWLRRVAGGGRETGGVTIAEAAAHLALVAALVAAHAALLVAIGALFEWRATIAAAWTIGRGAAAAYAPIDLATYAAVLGLGWLSDADRQAEDARRRAAALQATVSETRLAALRARLNPHFLYNALNAAVTLARAGRGRETSHVLEELTALLRYVLDDQATVVPLDAELAFVRRYLEIQRVRFGDRLSYDITVDDRVAAAMVLPLVLQPLVENAVEHAIASGEASRIELSAFADGGTLVLRVDDDGPGPAHESERQPSGIGLGHTRERLRTTYGGRASVTLAARAPRGARAEVRQPLVESPALVAAP